MTEPVWEWYISPTCGRVAYVPNGAYCQFCKEYLIPMATDKTAAPPKYQRAGQYDEFGKSLDGILDKDMILRSFQISERGLTDRETKTKEDRTFVLIKLNQVDDADDEAPQIYHAWSGDLANKLAQIPNDALPLLIMFKRVATAGGFKVYTFE